MLWNTNISSVKALRIIRLSVIIIITLAYLLPNHKCNSQESIKKHDFDSNTEVVYIEDDDDDADDNDIGDIPLSRKKRALTFPSGSSLQLGRTYLRKINNFVKF